MLTIANRRVLVLNKLWTAVGVASLQRAIALLYQEYSDGKPKAQIVTPPPIGQFETYTWADWAEMRPAEGEEVIRATRDRLFKVPDVILLAHYEGQPCHRVNFSRRHIYKRDNYQCMYCGCRPGTESLTIDHVVPKCQGGLTSWTNCVLCCINCNTQKADKRPEQAFQGKRPTYHPIRHPDGWRGPSPMKLKTVPVKPKFTLFKGDVQRVPKTWQHWLDATYWNLSLVNDMPDDEDDFSDV
jgi:5-methylcytosine-specific restriction endonuclease McrA